MLGGRLLLLLRGIDEVAQLLAGLEVRYALGRHLDLGPGFRIAPDTRLALPNPKGAEAPDFYLVALLQRADDGVTVSTITSPSRRVRSPSASTSSTRLALVIVVVGVGMEKSWKAIDSRNGCVISAADFSPAAIGVKLRGEHGSGAGP